MKTLILALVALTALAPLAQAQDSQASTSDEPLQYGDGSCIECSGPADPVPVHYGEDGCIDCTGAPVDPSTCMDGADEGEACDPDVQYFGPGPADTGDLDDVPPAGSDADPDSAADAKDAKDTPALPALALLAVLGAVVLLSRRV